VTSASYFLTGENRNYDRDNACFGRIKPRHPFDMKGSWGAWGVPGRWPYLNLQSKGVMGGIENNVSGGLNWYPTANTRWMLNYVYADVDNRQVSAIQPQYPNTIAQASINVIENRFGIVSR
jgi:phosphate-selective porin OprO/OprP